MLTLFHTLVLTVSPPSCGDVQLAYVGSECCGASVADPASCFVDHAQLASAASITALTAELQTMKKANLETHLVSTSLVPTLEEDPGPVFFTWGIDIEHPTHYYFIEEWATNEAFAIHAAASQYNAPFKQAHAAAYFDTVTWSQVALSVNANSPIADGQVVKITKYTLTTGHTESEFTTPVLASLTTTREASGCSLYLVTKDIMSNTSSQPTASFIVVEKWASQTEYDAHLSQDAANALVTNGVATREHLADYDTATKPFSHRSIAVGYISMTY